MWSEKKIASFASYLPSSQMMRKADATNVIIYSFKFWIKKIFFWQWTECFEYFSRFNAIWISTFVWRLLLLKKWFRIWIMRIKNLQNCCEWQTITSGIEISMWNQLWRLFLSWKCKWTQWRKMIVCLMLNAAKKIKVKTEWNSRLLQATTTIVTCDMIRVYVIPLDALNTRRDIQSFIHHYIIIQ